MAIQLSVATRNARLNAINTILSTAATVLKIWSGAMPASCATADSGTQLASPTLPNPPFAAAAGGSMSKTGTWEDTSADASGTAGYFRLYDNAGVCHMQGTVTQTGGGGDMTVDNTNFATGQDFVVTGFTLTDANA